MISLHFVSRLQRALLCMSIFALFSVLSACSVLPKSPSLQSYLLPTYSLGREDTAKIKPVNWSLRINQPNTTQFLNSTRVAVQPQGAEIAVYKGIRWSDSVPVLVRNRLLQEFRADARIQKVVSNNDRLQVDYELRGDLTAFQGVYHTSGSVVLIRFDAYLVRTMDQHIIASHSFEVRQPITGKSMDEVVKAFGLANDQFSEQLLNWTVKQAGNAGNTSRL